MVKLAEVQVMKFLTKSTFEYARQRVERKSAITAIMRRNYDINGILDFDSNISMIGFKKQELLNSLKGNLNFIISNGRWVF